MHISQYKGRDLEYLTAYPDNYDPKRDYPLIILLHGFGSHMGDLAQLAPAIDPKGYLYVFPNAPNPVTLGGGMVGYSWTKPRDEPEELAETVTLLETFIADIISTYSIGPSHAILGGFSQGGGITYRFGLERPDIFCGLIALSSIPLDEEIVHPFLPPKRDQQIFIAHGSLDKMLSVGLAYRTRNFLIEEGYSPIFREYPMGHEIRPEVLSDLIPWIHDVLPPGPTLQASNQQE